MAQECDEGVERPDAGAEAPGLWSYSKVTTEASEAATVTEGILANLGEEVKSAVEFYHDDWLLKAYRRLCREVLDPLREVEKGAGENTALQSLLRKAASELGKDDELWALVREAEEALSVLRSRVRGPELGATTDETGWEYSHKAGGVNVWLRPSKYGINSVRMHAVYPTNIMNLLPVINEVALHQHLVPFLHAVDEAQISRVRKSAFGMIKVPLLSALVSPRYFSLYGYAVDAIDEDGAILILVRDKSKAGEDSLDKECESANVQVDKSSVIQGPDSPLGKFATAARETIMDVEYRVQQEEKAAVQCIIHQATFVIRPGIHPDSLEHGKHSNQRNAPSDSEKRNYTTIEIGSSFDPQIALAPTLINFLVKNFCHVAMQRMGKVACTGTEDHHNAVDKNQDFYDWVKDRVSRI